MSRYKVMVDDNFHYMDETERVEDGVFATAEEAIAECKGIVDDDLNSTIADKPKLTAKELYELYVHFGPDPFIVPINKDDEVPEFRAWDYAKERSQVLTKPSRKT
jgi:hypothetical protein